MRHMRSRRILAMLLALSMIFGLLTTSALAANTEDGQNTSVTENPAENQTVGETQKGEGTTGDSETPPTEDSKQEDSKEEEKESAQDAPQADEGEGTPAAAENNFVVDGQGFATLDEAIAALSEHNYTLTVNNDAWGSNGVVYWKAGEQSNYEATLKDALKAAYMANAAGNDITIVCKPGADVGKMTHGHVADSITIYGNNAYISSGECDLEVDTYKFNRSTGTQYAEEQGSDEDYLAKDITITGYELDNLGVWGQRHTENTVTINLTDCDSTEVTKAQRVYITNDANPNGRIDITLTGCDFKTDNTSVYSNADGDIKITNCTFTGTKVPVNFNHTSSGTQTLDVSGCTFTNCGDAVDWPTFAAPVRFVNSGDGKQEATVSKCSFNGTKGSNGDILLGDGREGKPSKDVSLSVSGTAANVVAQQPGYYPNEGEVDSTKRGDKPLEESETFNTTANELASGTTTELTAYVTVNDDETKYETLDEAREAAEPVNGAITYHIYGKIDITQETNFADGIYHLTKTGSTASTVNIVGASEDAELHLADEKTFIGWNDCAFDVNLSNLVLSRVPGTDGGNSQWCRVYFTVLTDASHTVSYTGCTFPNGSHNNWFGTTSYTNCKFKNANTGKYNLWVQQATTAKTTVTDCTFEGVRGVKVYDTQGTDNRLEIKDTTFTNLTEKAAVVASKAASITFDKVTTTGCAKGTFQKDISGEKVTVEANGSDISGAFNITNTTGTDAAKEEFNISAGTFNADVSTDYLAEGVEIKDDGNGNYGVTEAASAPTFNEDGTITDVTAKNVQDLLDGKYGSIDGKTIVLSAGEYPQLVLGRATKYVGSNTKYFVGGFDASAKNYQEFATADELKAHKNQTGWTASCYYTRSMKNVTLAAAKGETVTVAGIIAPAGHIYSNSYDYVRDTEVTSTNNGYYFAEYWENITFEGLSFTSAVNIESSSSKTSIDGLHFSNCSFNSGYSTSDDKANGMGIRFVSWTTDTNDNLKNLTVNECSFSYCYEGVYTNPVYGITVTNSTFENINHNAVAVQDTNGVTSHGEVVITGNTFTNINDRIMRFNNVGADTTIKITGNTSVASGDTDGEIIKATTMAEGVTVDMTSTANTWGDNAEGVPAKLGNGFADSDKVAEVGGVKYATITEAISKATDGGTVKLIADATEDVTINKNITLDLNGFTLTNKGDHTITNNGTLTITDGSAAKTGKVDNVTHQMAAIVNYGTMTLNGGTYTRSKEAGADKDNPGGNSYYTILNDKGGKLTIKNGVTVENKGHFSSMIRNGGEGKESTLIIEGGTFTGGINTVKNDALGKLTINGGTFSNTTQFVVMNWNVADIQSGTFELDTKVKSSLLFSASYGDGAIGQMTISGGAFHYSEAQGLVDTKFSPTHVGTLAVSGGTFAHAVDSKYCAEGFEPVKNANGTFGVKETRAAQIGNTEYETLAAAFAAAQDGDTIVLLKDSSGDGIVVKEGTFANKGLTVNFNNHSYTVGGKLVGSSGTASNGFQLLKGNKITFKNGTIDSDGDKCVPGDAKTKWSGAPAVMIQNYSDLTLKNMTVTGGAQTAYTMSNNHGNVVIEDTIINAGESKGYPYGPYAFDACGFSSYDGVSVTVKGNSVINGDIEVSRSSNNEKDVKLSLESGTFNGVLKIDSTIKQGDATTVSKSENFTAAAPEGYKWVASEDGTTSTLKKMASVAKIGTTEFESLADAINAANEGDTVTLLADVTENDLPADSTPVVYDLTGKTLDLNGYTYSAKNFTHVFQGTGGTIKNGKMVCLGGSYALFIGDEGETKSFTVEDVVMTGGINVYNATNVTLKNLTVTGTNYYAVWADAGTYVIIESGSYTHGDAAVVGGAEEEAKLDIKGGNFHAIGARNNTLVFAGTVADNLNIFGGTFDVAVDAKYCAAGYIPKANEDGTTFGVTEGTYVASITVGEETTKYTSLEAAYAEAKDGGTITLLADCSSDRINLEDKSITVALNGHTLTSTAAYGVMFCAKNGHTITIDGTKEGSKLVGTVMVTANTDGHIVLNGGTYESAQYCPIYINGAVNSDNSTLTVTNATITALEGTSDQDNGVAVYLAGYSTSTFTNTTIEAPSTGLEIRAGKLTLDNCNVTGGHNQVVTDANGNGTTVTNAAIAVSQHTTKKPIEVTINGGTYNATAAFYQTDVQNTGSEGVKTSIEEGTFIGSVSTETAGTLAISGGSFSSEVKAEHCAPGFVPTTTKNAQGYYGVEDANYVASITVDGKTTNYTTLEEALNAAQAGEKVVLTADASAFVADIRPNITLDLNGHNLKADYIGYFGGDMINSGTKGVITGLKAEKTTFIQGKNDYEHKITQIPVFSQAKQGYVLVEVTIRMRNYKNTPSGALKAGYDLTTTGASNSELFGKSNSFPATAAFRLTYKYKDELQSTSFDFDFVDAYMEQYVDLNLGYMYVLVTGFDFDKLESISIASVLKSADGKVEFYGSAYDTEQVLQYFVNKQ